MMQLVWSQAIMADLSAILNGFMLTAACEGMCVVVINVNPVLTVVMINRLITFRSAMGGLFMSMNRTSTNLRNILQH